MAFHFRRDHLTPDCHLGFLGYPWSTKGYSGMVDKFRSMSVLDLLASHAMTERDIGSNCCHWPHGPGRPQTSEENQLDTLQENMEDVACLSFCYLLCVRYPQPRGVFCSARSQYGNSFYGAFSWGDSYFNLWLQSLNKYSVENINNIPTAGQGAAVVNSILSGYISDWLENRPLIIGINMVFASLFVFLKHMTSILIVK